MAGAISLYLPDETLRKLDAAVARQAQEDRSRGLSGRQVANRSKMVAHIVESYLGSLPTLSLEDIRESVVPVAKEFGAAKVSLFGSYARGQANAQSDVDILLDKGDIKGLRVLDFQDELARRLNRPVDVVTTVGASERFLSKIRRDEVVLYEAS